MNLKCFFGFHNYKSVNGLWWKNHTTISGSMLGINVIKLYQCTKCKKVQEKIIETYSMPEYDMNNVKNYIENAGINPILTYYDN